MGKSKVIFDNCHEEGLEHAWRTYRFNEFTDEHRRIINVRLGEASEILIEEPQPRKEKARVTYFRECMNCRQVEEFVEKASGEWMPKGSIVK